MQGLWNVVVRLHISVNLVGDSGDRWGFVLAWEQGCYNILHAVVGGFYGVIGEHLSPAIGHDLGMVFADPVHGLVVMDGNPLCFVFMDR